VGNNQTLTNQGNGNKLFSGSNTGILGNQQNNQTGGLFAGNNQVKVNPPGQNSNNPPPSNNLFQNNNK
jgi:hypothetical protein